MSIFKSIGDWLYDRAWEVLEEVDRINQRQDATNELILQLAAPMDDWDTRRFDDIPDLVDMVNQLDWSRRWRAWLIRLLRLGIVITDRIA